MYPDSLRATERDIYDEHIWRANRRTTSNPWRIKPSETKNSMTKRRCSPYGPCYPRRPHRSPLEEALAVPLGEALALAEKSGLIPAYLAPSALAYLGDVLGGEAPERAPSVLSASLDHQEHGAPLYGRETLYFLTPLQIYALENSPQRFGQANSEAPFSDHTPTYAPNGIRSFIGAGTLRAASAAVPLNNQIDPRLYFSDGSVYLLCPAITPSDPLGQRPLGCLSSGFNEWGAPNFPKSTEPFLSCDESLAGSAMSLGSWPANSLPAGICGPPDNVPFWNEEGTTWREQNHLSLKIVTASTLSPSAFFLAGALTSPTSSEILDPAVDLPLIRAVPITPPEMFQSYGTGQLSIPDKLKPPSALYNNELTFATNWQDPSNYSRFETGGYTFPGDLPCSPADGFLTLLGNLYRPCILGEDFYRSGAAMWAVRHGPPGTQTMQLENLYTGSYLSAGALPAGRTQAYQTQACRGSGSPPSPHSGITCGNTPSELLPVKAFLRSRPAGVTNGSWDEYGDTLWTCWAPGPDTLGPSGVVGLLGSAPYTAMMAQRSLILQHQATGTLLSLGGHDYANMFYATTAENPESDPTHPWKPGQPVALLANMFVFHAVPPERIPSDTVTYAGTRLNVTEAAVYANLLEKGATVREFLGPNAYANHLADYLFPASGAQKANITQTASTPPEWVGTDWAARALNLRYDMLQKTVDTRGGIVSAAVPPIPWSSAAFTLALGKKTQAAFDGFTARQRLAGLAAIATALTVLVSRLKLRSTIAGSMAKYKERAQLKFPALFHFDGFHRSVFNLFSLAYSFETPGSSSNNFFRARRKPVFPVSGSRFVPVLGEITMMRQAASSGTAPTTLGAPLEGVHYGGNAWILSRAGQEPTAPTARNMVLAEFTSPTTAKFISDRIADPYTTTVLGDWNTGKIPPLSLSLAEAVGAVQVGGMPPYSCAGPSNPEDVFWGPFYPDQPCQTTFAWTTPVISNSLTVMPCPAAAVDLFGFATENEATTLDVQVELLFKKGVSNLLVTTVPTAFQTVDSFALGIKNGEIILSRLDSPEALEFEWVGLPEGSFKARAKYMGGLVLGYTLPPQENPALTLVAAGDGTTVEELVLTNITELGISGIVGNNNYFVGFPDGKSTATEGTPVRLIPIESTLPEAERSAWIGPATTSGSLPPQLSFHFSYPGSSFFNVAAAAAQDTTTPNCGFQVLPNGGKVHEDLPVWRMLQVKGDPDGRCVLAVNNNGMFEYTYLTVPTLASGAEVSFTADATQATPILVFPIIEWDGEIPALVDYANLYAFPYAAPFFRPPVANAGLPAGTWFQLLVKVSDDVPGPSSGAIAVPNHLGTWLALSVGDNNSSVVSLASAGSQGGLTQQALCHIYAFDHIGPPYCSRVTAGPPEGIRENLSLTWSRVSLGAPATEGGTPQVDKLLSPFVLADVHSAAHDDPAWTGQGGTTPWSIASQVFSFSCSAAYAGDSVAAATYLQPSGSPVFPISERARELSMRTRIIIPLIDQVAARSPVDVDSYYPRSVVENAEDAVITSSPGLDGVQEPPLPQTQPSPRPAEGYLFDAAKVTVTAKGGICGIAGLVLKPTGTIPPALAPLRRSQALPSGGTPSSTLAVFTSLAAVYRGEYQDPLTADTNLSSAVQLLLNSKYTSVDEVHSQVQSLADKPEYQGYTFGSLLNSTTAPPAGLPQIFQFDQSNYVPYGLQNPDVV